MRKALINRIMSTTLLLALTPVAHANDADLNGSLYLETTSEMNLFLPTILSDGQRALAPGVKTPGDSIIAIDIRDLKQSLVSSKDSPERINYPFVTSPQDKETQRNNKGWICGIRIVDINDEDMREDEITNRTDFCMSLEEIQNITALETNSLALKESFEQYRQQNNLELMTSLADHIEQEEALRESRGVISLVADGPSMVSPVQNCGKGCLVATSEFGNRMHPVLKKRRLHKGIDLRAKIGTPIVSVLDGKILANRSERSAAKKGKTGSLKGYGHYVIVVHPGSKMETLYAHLSGFKKKAGDTVKQGDLIALSGNTGIGTAPHLHFETHTANKKSYTPTNPRSFIGKLLGTVAWVMEAFSFHT